MLFQHFCMCLKLRNFCETGARSILNLDRLYNISIWGMPYKKLLYYTIFLNWTGDFVLFIQQKFTWCLFSLKSGPCIYILHNGIWHVNVTVLWFYSFYTRKRGLDTKFADIIYFWLACIYWNKLCQSTDIYMAPYF